MLEGEVASDFVVDDDGADGVGFELASDHGGGDAAFFEIAEEIDIEEDPVGDDDESLDATIEQHLEITLETAAFVVDVGENREIGRLVERVLDAAKNQGAERVGHVEDHDADGMAALAAQGAGELVGAVSELLGGALDALFGDSRNVARQGRVVQDNGNGGGGESAFLSHVANGHHIEACFKFPVSEFQVAQVEPCGSEESTISASALLA